MINTGKCPKCDKTVSSVTIEDIDVKVNLTSKWRGISYLCGSCKTVLGVGIDPVALKSDTIKGVVLALKGG
jgi:hypothetical protein